MSIVLQALDALRAAPGVIIRQPLRAGGQPLPVMDYHAIAAAERVLYPELVLPVGTHRAPERGTDARSASTLGPATLSWIYPGFTLDLP